MLGRINCSPVNSTSLSLPLVNTFVQVMFGAGSPSALQVKVIAGSPSRTTWSGALVINDGGSTTASSTKKMFITSILFVKGVKGCFADCSAHYIVV